MVKRKNEAEAEVDAEESEAAVAAERKRIKREKKAAALAEAEAEAEAEEAAVAERRRLKKEKKRAAKELEEAEEEPPAENTGKRSVDAEAPPAVAAEPEEVFFTAFIGGLPSHVDEDLIKKDFGECGEITNLILAKWPEDGSSKGIAFISFSSDSALNKCIEWNGEYYNGKNIRVEKKEGKDRPVQRKDMGLGGQRGQKPEGCVSVAVLDMSKTVTDDDLWSHFEKCGKISAVKILKHRETFESRGIAFVTFEDTDATDNAVRLTGSSLGGKPARVEYAAPKNDAAGKGKDKGKGKGKGGPEKPEGCLSVVIFGLSLRATEDDLWSLVHACKSANNVSIVRDKNTDQPKGMAFIDFDDTNDTDAVVKLSGKEIHGQAVSIRFKAPKW